MSPARIITGVAVVAVCLLGAVVLHLLGVPWPGSIVIGILAGAATAFTSWTRNLHSRRRAPDMKD